MKNYQYDKSELYDIAKKSRTIANSIGNPLIEEGYYSDRVIGHEYKYDQLRISYYNSGFVHIYINNIEVLSCDFGSNEINCLDGKWKNVIEGIYQNINSILEERKKESLYRERIVSCMLEMQEYFKWYLECQKKGIIIEELNLNLRTRGITVSSEKHYSTIRNLCTGEYEDSAVADNIYTVFYHSSEVAQFNGNVFNIFPNVSWYANKFVPGEWTYIFKQSVSNIKSKELAVTQQTIDDISQKILNRFQKSK